MVPWPGRVVATLASQAFAIAYDPVGQVVWVPVSESGGPDYLYRYDPRTAKTDRWALPSTTYEGVLAQVLVDTSGAVWINDDGYRLVRFDPATGQMTSHVFPLKVPGTDSANGGTWISAIAVDGDGVLVARNQVSVLVRVDASLSIGSPIDLPKGFDGSTGLAVAGGHIFITNRVAGTVARLSLDGRLEASFPVSASRLEPHGDGVVTRHSLYNDYAPDQILAADGTVEGTVPPAFTLPPTQAYVTSPLGTQVLVNIPHRPSALVSDGSGTSWYLTPNRPELYELDPAP